MSTCSALPSVACCDHCRLKGELARFPTTFIPGRCTPEHCRARGMLDRTSDGRGGVLLLCQPIPLVGKVEGEDAELRLRRVDRKRGAVPHVLPRQALEIRRLYDDRRHGGGGVFAVL